MSKLPYALLFSGTCAVSAMTWTSIIDSNYISVLSHRNQLMLFREEYKRYADQFKEHGHTRRYYALQTEWCDNSLKEMDNYAAKPWYYRLFFAPPCPDFTQTEKYAWDHNYQDLVGTEQ